VVITTTHGGTVRFNPNLYASGKVWQKIGYDVHMTPFFWGFSGLPFAVGDVARARVGPQNIDAVTSARVDPVAYLRRGSVFQ
jgi:hypothetical protein